MFQQFNRKLVFYSSLFISSAISLPRLLRWVKGENISNLIAFNIFEWLISFVLLFILSVIIFKICTQKISLFYNKLPIIKYANLTIQNIAFLLIFTIISTIIGKMFIAHTQFPLNGNLVRFLMAQILVLIEVKIVAIKRLSEIKEGENEQLRYVNTKMELELLKSQLNPHFLFNSLSSLAGTVHENPQLAQKYILQLSNYFRYSLNKNDLELSTLEDELASLNNFAGLLSMRFEEGFTLQINLDKSLMQHKLPNISLQPLLENALKHNVALANKPLIVTLKNEGNLLIFSNNIQIKSFPEPGTGTGLVNLAERYKLLMQKEIEIISTESQFIIKLPLNETNAANSNN